MRYRVCRADIVHRLTVALLTIASSLWLATMNTPTTQALDTSVRAVVNNGDVSPTLSLVGDGTAVTISTLPYNLSGTYHDLTEIRVYVDDIFSVTIPIDPGNPQFHYGLTVPVGLHTVKLLGISALPDSTPTATISLIYTPPGSSQAGAPANGTWKGTIIGEDSGAAGSTIYTEQLQNSVLPGWLYNGLVALDIIKPGNTSGAELAKTLQRITLVGAGLFLVVFSRPTLFLYRTVRYKWFGLRKRSMPAFLRRHPLGYIRVVGIILIACVFALI